MAKQNVKVFFNILIIRISNSSDN